MRQLSTLFLLFFLPLFAWAQQTVTVPKNVYFADIHLTITDGAQQEIQKKVDALHKNPAYFQAKVDLADAYFPLVDQIFKEEGVPADLKFLAVQESGLIGDAVSTSNAVGYWQFKREAASDFNLRVDNVIDERKHIIEASRGAAKYFKRSNNYYNNWFNSILSYYLGYSGAKSQTSPSDIGSKKMTITEKTHPYLLTFLAHKIAYENFVGKNTKPAIALRPLHATPGQSLAEIALDNQADFAELEKYNKWLLGSTIPSDKSYYVLLPVRGEERTLVASSQPTTTVPATQVNKKAAAAAAVMVSRNGLNALVARPGDTKDKLALQAGISTRKFLKYNDLRSFDKIEEGSAYYIEKKKTSATAEYHVVQPGENMLMISQHYGIRLQYLLFKNRMKRNEVPVPGRVLWLQKRRPATSQVEVRDLNNKQTIAKHQTAPVKEATPATKQETVKSAPAKEQPNENVFTRFINSLKKDKKQPEPAKQETKPVAKTIKPEPEEVEAVEEVTVEEEVIVVEEPAKPITPKAVYPGKTIPPVPAETKPAAAPAKPEATTKPATTPAATIKPATPAQEVVPAKTEIIKETTAKAEPVKQTETIVADKEELEAAAKTARHVVAKGESLYSISKMYGKTIAEITSWNNLANSAIKPGQELIVAEPINAAPVSAAAAHQAPKQTTDYHTVVAGETLYQLSKKYNVTMDELMEWNNLGGGALSIGQQLRLTAPANVPAPKTETTPTEEAAPAQKLASDTYHTVVAGESLYQISRKYGATIKDIMDWNKKPDFNVKPGEKLLIRKQN